MTFTKLFASITESTIWREDNETRLVWITMLAMCNKNGYVFASVPGLADRARVSIECTEKALGKFMAPDKYSRSKEYDGRRIEEVDGGWILLNYRKHRDIRDEEDRREYMRTYMKRRRKHEPLTNVNNVNSSKPQLAQAEAEAEADTEKSKAKSSVGCRLPGSFKPKGDHYLLSQSLGINCEMEFQKFRDYFLGVSGSKGIKRDWDATLRNWLRNSVNYGGRNGGSEPRKVEKRAQQNREAIVTGLGFSPDAGLSGSGDAARSYAGGSPLLVGDVLEREPGDAGVGIPRISERGRVLSKAVPNSGID